MNQLNTRSRHWCVLSVARCLELSWSWELRLNTKTVALKAKPRWWKYWLSDPITGM